MGRNRRFAPLILILLCIGILLIVVACGDDDDDSYSESERKEHVSEESGWEDIGLSVDIKKVTVDGVPCIVVDDDRGTAISCNWPETTTTTAFG